MRILDTELTKVRYVYENGCSKVYNLLRKNECLTVLGLF